MNETTKKETSVVTPKEDKVVAPKKTTKKSTTKKETTKKSTTKKVSTDNKKEAKATTEVVANKDKKDDVLTIQEINELYTQAGIKVYNPEGKGGYRIMGMKGGSSLNIKRGKYYIYSTPADYDLVKTADGKYSDLVVEEGTNSTDKIRPNTIICETVETLKAILKLYSQNSVNKLAPTTK